MLNRTMCVANFPPASAGYNIGLRAKKMLPYMRVSAMKRLMDKTCRINVKVDADRFKMTRQ